MEVEKKQTIERIFLYIFLITSFLIPFIGFESRIEFKYVHSVFLAILTVIGLTFFRFWKLSPFKKINRYVLIFFGINIIMLPFSINMGDSIKQIIQFFNYFMAFNLAIYFTVQFKNDEGILEFIKKIMFISIFILIIKAAMQYFFEFDYMIKNIKHFNIPDEQLGDFLVRLNEKRVYSFFIYSNVFGAYLNLFIPVLFFLFLKSKSPEEKMTRYISLSLFILTFVTLFFTRSIGVILSLFSGIVIGLLFFSEKIKGKIKNIIFGLLVLFIISIIIVFSIRIKDVSDPDSLANPFVMRLFNWSSALKIFIDNPLTGVGLGNFGDIYPKYLIKGETQHVHNSYLELLLESGLIAFMVLLLICIEFFRKSRFDFANTGLKPGLNLFIFISIIIFILHNFVDFSFYIYSTGYFFSLFCGLHLGLRHDSLIYR